MTEYEEEKQEDTMTLHERLKLHDIADTLDRVLIDDGPMGESTPFHEEAEQLRELAKFKEGDEE